MLFDADWYEPAVIKRQVETLSWLLEKKKQKLEIGYKMNEGEDRAVAELQWYSGYMWQDSTMTTSQFEIVM